VPHYKAIKEVKLSRSYASQQTLVISDCCYASPAVFTISDAITRIGVTTWLFGVTWRHRLADHSIPYGPFAVSGPLKRSLYLQPFSILIRVTRLPFRGHVTSSVTWPFDSPSSCHAIDGPMEARLYL